MHYRIRSALRRRMLQVCAVVPITLLPRDYSGEITASPRENAESLTAFESTFGRSGRFAEIYRFPLRATSRARGAGGEGQLHLAQSPFGIAMTARGFLVYDLEVTVKGLRPAASLGGTYIAWLTTPELDRTVRLGPIDTSASSTYSVSTMSKFIFIVSLEESEDVLKRSGPTVLRGISPSGLMQNMESHELFSTMPHEF